MRRFLQDGLPIHELSRINIDTARIKRSACLFGTGALYINSQELSTVRSRLFCAEALKIAAESGGRDDFSGFLPWILSRYCHDLVTVCRGLRLQKRFVACIMTSNDDIPQEGRQHKLATRYPSATALRWSATARNVASPSWRGRDAAGGESSARRNAEADTTTRIPILAPGWA